MKIDPSAVGAPVAGADRSGDLRAAAEAFEALLLQSLVQRMRESQLAEGFFGESSGASIYEGMFEQYLADALASHSPLGIAHLLEERWSEGGGGETAPDAATNVLAAERAGRTYRSALEGIASVGSAPAAALAPAAPAHYSRDFGPGRDPIDGRPRFHGGVDIPAPIGTPVRSLAAGRVSLVEERGGYGLRIEVEHAGGWTTTYSHLSRAGVSPGQRVARGQDLGTVGVSGRATGPHLHFEALKGGVKVDPRRVSHAPLPAQVLGNTAEENDERDRSPVRR